MTTEAEEIEQVILELARDPLSKNSIIAVAVKAPHPPIGAQVLIRDANGAEHQMRVFEVQEYSESSKRAYQADYKIRCSGPIFGSSVWYKFIGVIGG